MTDPDEVKLLPCPGCNGDAGNNLFVDRNADGWWRYNCECGWSGPLMRTKKDSFLAWSTRPPVVTDEVVERVARAIAIAVVRQDYMTDTFEPRPDWGMKVDYLDQGEVDFAEVARAAIASMPAVVSGGQSE